MRLALGIAVMCLSVAGCATSGDDPNHPDVVLVSPTLAPPPAYSDRSLSREAVQKLAESADDPADAIRELDDHPFDFELTDDALTWFGEAGLDPAILDYLRKRSKIDWSSLRGDVDPETPR